MNAYKQGYFKPNNAAKYIGTTPIVYRSGLELLFMRWCDRNDKILEWGSESVVIPYVSPLDGKTHRYFTDANIALQTATGIKKYIVEIKPFRQTQEPNNNGNKKRQTLLREQVAWAVNTSKWQAARSWAEKKNWNFVIITEKDLKT